ncbi:MAG: AsmA-like C-terminal domain-containing protein [Kiritimatiellae bacterium]|nr:AsmA-like C-terminal domain-containing protein [Kiritimatiellia bacterium]
MVTIGNGKFRFFKNFDFYNVRVFDKTKTDFSPILQIEKAEIKTRSFSWPIDASSVIKSLTITKLKYSRLPDGYYIPDSIEFPGKPDFVEQNSPLELDLPEFLPFSLTLIQPEIVGVRPKKVEIERVSSTGRAISFNDILIHWPDADTPMTLTGECSFDLDTQYVKGEVHGFARQHNIRPMLEALDIKNSFQFIDGFTHVKAPVKASCAFDVNLRNNDLHLLLHLHPQSGRYNSVPFSYAAGPLDIRVFVRDTYQNAVIKVGPLDVSIADGSKMAGSVIYENTNDVGFVVFDVDSTTSLSNSLAIADIFTDGTLDCIQPMSSTKMTLKGKLASLPENAHLNDLQGSVSFSKGTLFGIPLRAAESIFTLKGTEVSFFNARASAARGGEIEGSAKLSIPEFKQDNATFQINIAADNVQLTDFGDLFNVDIGKRRGIVKGHIDMTGPLSTNSLPRLRGKGDIKISKAYFADLSIFKGLVEQLISIIPGIDSNFFEKAAKGANQVASCDFEVKDGKLSSENIVFEGSFISIKAKGVYDMINDKLDFKCQVRLFKDRSIMALLTRPFTAAISKYLLEFSVGGTLEKPTWEYISPFKFTSYKK